VVEEAWGVSGLMGKKDAADILFVGFWSNYSAWDYSTINKSKSALSITLGTIL